MLVTIPGTDMASPEEMLDSSYVNDLHQWRVIIAELAGKAPSTVIRDCIRAYNPENPTKQNAKALKAFPKDVINATLKFLSRRNSINANKNDLINMLCLKIKNFFPDICQVCHNSYTFKIDDVCFLSCASCGQEVHRPCYLQLLKDMNLIDEEENIRDMLFKIPGFFFLCPSCQEETVIPVNLVEGVQAGSQSIIPEVEEIDHEPEISLPAKSPRQLSTVSTENDQRALSEAISNNSLVEDQGASMPGDPTDHEKYVPPRDKKKKYADSTKMAIANFGVKVKNANTITQKYAKNF